MRMANVTPGFVFGRTYTRSHQMIRLANVICRHMFKDLRRLYKHTYAFIGLSLTSARVRMIGAPKPTEGVYENY